MTTSFKPLRDFIHIEPITTEQKIGSLFIISEDHEKPTRGKVLAVGPGLRVKGELKPVPVSVGDIIGFSKGSVLKIQVGRDTIHVVPASQLLGIES